MRCSRGKGVTIGGRGAIKEGMTLWVCAVEGDVVARGVRVERRKKGGVRIGR